MKRKMLIFINFIFILIITTSCMFTGQNGSGPNNGLLFTTNDFLSLHTVISLTMESEGQTKDIKLFKNIENIFNKIDKEADASLSIFINEYSGKLNKNEDIKVDKITSELGKLNYYREYKVSKELIELLEFATMCMEETNGYFNPFLGILNANWKAVISGFSKVELISEGEAKMYSKYAQEAKLDINKETGVVRLLNKDDNLSSYDDYLVDLGGIAKGYATEKAKSYLKSQGKRHYILNAGASNIEVGIEPLKEYFDIGISYVFGYPNKEPVISTKDGYFTIDGTITKAQSKGNKMLIAEEFLYIDKSKLNIDDYVFALDNCSISRFDGQNLSIIESLNPLNIKAKNQAIVTSSPGEQNKIVNGKIYHHIINPKTGYPAGINDEINCHKSITILGQDSGMLDAFTTALFCMNEDEARAFIKDNNLKVVYLVNDKKYISDGIIYE